MGIKRKLRRRIRNTGSFRSIKYLRVRSFRDADFARFVQKYLLRTLYSIFSLVVLFILADKYIPEDFISIFDPVTHNNPLMFMIFFISEAVLGIIPPDLFIRWASIKTDALMFIGALAILSYLGGVISFLIGKTIGNYPVFERIVTKIRSQFESKIQQWGGMVIVLAALTPIPFSPISMLCGSLKFPFKKYVIYSLARFIRVIGYGLIFMMF